jgi:hypothetical protein
MAASWWTLCGFQSDQSGIWLIPNTCGGLSVWFGFAGWEHTFG